MAAELDLLVPVDAGPKGWRGAALNPEGAERSGAPARHKRICIAMNARTAQRTFVEAAGFRAGQRRPGQKAKDGDRAGQKAARRKEIQGSPGQSLSSVPEHVHFIESKRDGEHLAIQLEIAAHGFPVDIVL